MQNPKPALHNLIVVHCSNNALWKSSKLYSVAVQNNNTHYSPSFGECQNLQFFFPSIHVDACIALYVIFGSKLTIGNLLVALSYATPSLYYTNRASFKLLLLISIFCPKFVVFCCSLNKRYS